MRIACPTCDYKFNVSSQSKGAEVPCPSCGEAFAADSTHECGEVSVSKLRSVPLTDLAQPQGGQVMIVEPAAPAVRERKAEEGKHAFGLQYEFPNACACCCAEGDHELREFTGTGGWKKEGEAAPIVADFHGPYCLCETCVAHDRSSPVMLVGLGVGGLFGIFLLISVILLLGEPTPSAAAMAIVSVIGVGIGAGVAIAGKSINAKLKGARGRNCASSPQVRVILTPGADAPLRMEFSSREYGRLFVAANTDTVKSGEYRFDIPQSAAAT